MEDSQIVQAGINDLAVNKPHISFGSKVDEFLFNFLNASKSQKQDYEVPDTDELSKVAKDYLADFGIIVGFRASINRESRKYLLIVEPGWWDSLEDECDKFVEERFPEDVFFPTHYVINKTIDTYDEFEAWHLKLKEIYPSIIPLSDNSHLVKQNVREANAGEMAKDVASLGLTPFYVDEMLEPLVTEIKMSNKSTLEILQSIEKQILDAYSKDPSIILMNRGLHRDYVPVLFAYMYYKHRIPSHISKTGSRLYKDFVSKLMYSEKMMLVEEKVEFIKNLPRVCVYLDEQLLFPCFVYLEKSKIDCKVRLSYVDVEDIEASEVSRAVIDIFSLNVIPWEYEYQLKTEDIDIFSDTHDKILDLFKKFESKTAMGESMLDMTNAFLMELDGSKKLAYVEEIELNLPAVFTPLGQSGLETFEKIINTTSMKSLFPIDIFAGYQKVLGPHIASLKRALQKSGVTNLKNLGTFYKHDHAFGLLLNFFYEFSHHRLGLKGYNDFVTIGLWWKESETYRTALNKVLSQYLSPKRSRRFNNFFSIFGGPLPFMYSVLEIREEVLKEW